MLVLEIKDLENDRRSKRYGSDRDLYEFITSHYPIADSATDFASAVDALNNSGLFEANYGPYEPNIEENLLPEDYLTHNEIDPKE